MKKLLALLLTMCLLLTLSACGEDKPNTGKDETTDSQVNNTPADEQNPPLNGENLETYLWKLTYDADIWSFELDDLYSDEDYCSVTLEIPDGEDGYIINAEIRVSIEDAENFRSYLDSYGFDAYEYAVNDAYDAATIGGQECLMAEGNYWGSPCLRYIGRNESAGATIFVEIIGQYTDARVDQLLTGLTFTLTDVGNVDFPWPWDGQAFTGENHTVNMGDFTISSQWLATTEPLITKETFDHVVAAYGNNVFLLTEGVLKQYTMDDNGLTHFSDILTDVEFDSLQATTDGKLWLSAFMQPLSCYLDGSLFASYEGTEVVTMAPDGTWGISWFSGNECQKIMISDGNMTTEPMIFGDVDTISHLMVDNDYIYVCGSNVEGDHVVFVYRHDGILERVLTDDGDWGLGSITFMAKTNNGFIGLDGNMRELVFWSEDGTCLGTIGDSEIFGTDYPWFCGGTVLDDGSILVLLTEDRVDQSAMELVMYRVSGF